MNDVLRGLKQLQEAREGEGKEVKPEEERPPHEPAPPSRGEDKTLAGRVPVTLHRRFARLLLDAADELGVNRVYTDEALEAALLLILEDEPARAAWLGKLGTVRQERRGR